MVPLGTDMHPVTLTEMTVRGTSAVHQVFSLSREVRITRRADLAIHVVLK